MIQDLTFGGYWYLMFTLFGVLVLPLSMWVFRLLPDCGILLSRLLGWLLISFTAWFLAYLKLLPFTRTGLIVVSVFWLWLSVYLLKTRGAWMWRKFRQHWRTAFNGEILTILVYLLILFMRREDPSINSTEKPMDIMFLNALTVARTIPPPDPWFAGETVNYHYGGYLLHSVPAKLTGIPTEYVYNLAIAMLAALAASCAFVLGRALFGRCRWGAVSVVSTLLIGNPASVLDILNYNRLLENLHEWRWTYLWKSSRVIYDSVNNTPQETINEYPLFTILWGDLHPHFSNMPFVLFLLCLIFALYKALMHSPNKNTFYLHFPLLGVIAIAAAFTFPTNLFDFPTGSLVLGGVVLASVIYFLTYRGEKQISWASIAFRSQAVFIPFIAYLLAAPFWLEFQSPMGDELIHLSQYQSDLPEFLLVFGLHTAATLAYLFIRANTLKEKTGKEGFWFILIILAIVFVLLWGWRGHIVFALAPVIVLLLTGLLIYQCTLDPKKHSRLLQENFALILCIIGWALIAGCELIHLHENYASKRINTLFKFHMQAWLYFGIALPFLVYHSFQSVKNVRVKFWLGMPVVVLFLLSMITPFYVFTSLFMMPNGARPVTLDGMAYMKIERPHQYEIVQWLRENAAPDDIILELPGFAYSQDSFAAAYTGHASFIGWDNHEGLWRGHPPEIRTRVDESLQFFQSKNWEQAKSFLKKNQIKYVVLKRPECNQADQICRTRLQQFEQMKQSIFRERLQPVIVKNESPNSPELYSVPDNL